MRKSEISVPKRRIEMKEQKVKVKVKVKRERWKVVRKDKNKNIRDKIKMLQIISKVNSIISKIMVKQFFKYSRLVVQ